MHLDKIDDKPHRDALVDADVLQCAVSIDDLIESIREVK